MKTLKNYTRYLRENRLRELAIYNLQLLKNMDIPIVKLMQQKGVFKSLDDEATVKMTMESLNRSLESFENGTVYENAKITLQQWRQDKLPGIGKNEIHPSDLVLIYAVQKKAYQYFLPEFAPDSNEAIAILAEIEDFQTRVQTDATVMLFDIQKETEEKLKETESRFRLMIQNVKDYSIFMVDAEGKVQSWNEGAQRMYGYLQEEIIGKHMSMFYAANEINMTPPENNLKMAVENGHYETEGLKVRKNGSFFWAKTLYTPVYDDTGKLKGFSKIARDISESKKAEELQKRLFAMIEGSSDFIGFAEAKSRHIMYINQLGRKMTGIGKDEDVTKYKIDDVHPDWTIKILQEEAMKAAIENGIWKGECAFIDRQGKEIPVSMVLMAHKNAAGEVEYFSTISRDIREQKFAEEELRSVNNFLNSVLENIPNMVFVKDAHDLRFVRFNKAGENLLGYAKKDMLGKNDYDFFPKEQADFFTDNDQAVLKQNDIIDIPEEPISTKNGPRWLHTKKIPIIGPAGKPAYLLGISEDITEMRKAKLELERKTKELERSNAELEQFAYVASHDLQEPLRTVSSYMQLLASRYKDKLDKDANEFIDFAVDGSKRMRQLINSLLEYSRVNRDKPFEWVDTNELMKEIKNDIKDQIKESGAIIKHNGLPKIYGDYVLIGQLFQNLIGNAIKFHGEEKPEIKISGKQKNGSYLFSIEDNGIGIPKEYREKIFVIFQRLNSREKYPGTGIGLSICKKIVEKHGGKIWVESESGKGSSFFFTLNAH
jgi:PAS domain S-box-containing protein